MSYHRSLLISIDDYFAGMCCLRQGVKLTINTKFAFNSSNLVSLVFLLQWIELLSNLKVIPNIICFSRQFYTKNFNFKARYDRSFTSNLYNIYVYIPIQTLHILHASNREKVIIAAAVYKPVRHRNLEINNRFSFFNNINI